MEKLGGTYVQLGTERTEKRAIEGLVKQVAHHHAPGAVLRAQIMHGHNPRVAGLLREQMDQTYDCHWLPTGAMTVVLGAHTGPTMVGLAYGPQELFDEIPN